MYTPKQLASKRNVIKAHQAKKNRRKTYFKKKVEKLKVDHIPVVESDKNKQIVQSSNSLISKMNFAEIAQNQINSLSKAQCPGENFQASDSLISHMNFVEIAQNQIIPQPQAQHPEEQQNYTKVKVVSQLTKKRRKNKEKRQMMEECDQYEPEKRRFKRRQKFIFQKKEIFLSEQCKSNFVFDLRANEIKSIKKFISNASFFQMQYIIGKPGLGKTTSVLMAAEQAGIKQSQMILVSQLDRQTWRQTLLQHAGIKTSAPRSMYIFQKYIVKIRLFVFDEFDWMNPKMIDQIIRVFEGIGGILIFIGCSRDSLNRLDAGSISRFKCNEVLFVQYNAQQMRIIIQKYFPQISIQKRNKMIGSFLQRSTDLRKLIQYVEQIKDVVQPQGILDSRLVKKAAQKFSDVVVFQDIVQNFYKNDTLANYIIFMLQKKKFNKQKSISLPQLALPVEQHFTSNQILLKCTEMADCDLLKCQFRIRKHDSNRDWKTQQFTPTWHFQFKDLLERVATKIQIGNFSWRDLLPFSSKPKSVFIHDSEYSEPTTPINQTPMSNPDISSELERKSSENSLIFSLVDSGDVIPDASLDNSPRQKTQHERSFKLDRYAGLSNNVLSSFSFAWEREKKKLMKEKEQEQKRIIPYRPKPRHLRGKNVEQDQEQIWSNLVGAKFYID